MKTKTLVISSVAVLVVLLVFAVGSGGKGTPPSSTGMASASATIFKSSSCGCCGIYSTYLERKGWEVDVRNVPDIGRVKAEQGIPASMESCHTTLVEGYVVEGHMPVEAIDKLPSERPDIKGIAMPGMPSGSPGMPGAKQGAWVIYAIHQDGSTSEFMRI